MSEWNAYHTTGAVATVFVASASPRLLVQQRGFLQNSYWAAGGFLEALSSLLWMNQCTPGYHALLRLWLNIKLRYF
jgi:hypothetical protein